MTIPAPHADLRTEAEAHRDGEFTGKVMVVTGASGGIGGACAELLAARGATVAGLDSVPIDPEGSMCHLTVDITDDRAVVRTVHSVEEDLGPIFGLVHAAGVLESGNLVDLDGNALDRTFAVNVRGMYALTKAVVPSMVERRSGSVVTIASNAGRVPRVGLGLYGASKAAVGHLTKAFGLEHAGHGIRFNVVSPGSTHTAMLHSLWPDEGAAAATLDGSLEHYRVGIPNRRIGEPVDMAEAVAFLCSDRARHITMQDLVVDGGAALGA